MKIKKLIMAALAALSLGCCVCAAACFPADNGTNDGGNSGGDNGDVGGSENSTVSDFVEYRQQAVTVMNDNGFEIADFDGEATSAFAAAYAVDGGYYDELRELILGTDGVVEAAESLKQMREDMFNQSLFAGIIIGEALTTVYNADSFYNMCVAIKPWNQLFYMQKNGDTTIVNGVTFDGSGDISNYIIMGLNYVSETNYSYSFLMTYSGWGLRMYGNSDKFFISFYQSDKVGESYVYYAGNEDEGYFVESDELVDELVVGLSELMDYDKIIFDAENLRTRGDYELDSAQTASIIGKYFGTTPIESKPASGLYTQEYDGVTVAQYYIADGETTVVIPEGVDYIAADFYVSDYAGGVIESLEIPASVKGVVKQSADNPVVSGTGRINYVAAELSELDIRIICIDEYGFTINNNLIFGEISVAAGSPVFGSGTGHLFAKDGTPLYIVDKPLDNFSVAYLDEKFYNGIANGSYDNLLGAVEKLDIDTGDFTPEFNNYLWSILEKTTSLKELNFTTLNESDSNNYYFILHVNDDFTVNADITRDEYTYMFSFDNVGDGVGDVAFNVLSIPAADKANGYNLLNIFGNGENINARISLDMNELERLTDYRNTFDINGFLSVTYVYSKTLDIGDFRFRALGDLGLYGLELLSVEDGAAVDVPAVVEGLKIGVLLLNADVLDGKSVTINLPAPEDGEEKMQVHIVDYDDGGIHYPFEEELYYGKLFSEDIRLVCPWSYFESVEVLADGYKLRAVFDDCEYNIYDSETYGLLPEVTVTIWFGDSYVGHNVKIDGDYNRATVAVSDLYDYGTWENLTFTDADGNLYPVTRVEGELNFFVPELTENLELTIVGIDDIRLTFTIDGVAVLSDTFDRRGGEFYIIDAPEDGVRNLYMIFGDMYTGEKLLICKIPQGRMLDASHTPYDFGSFGNNSDRSDVLELYTIEELFFTVTVNLLGNQTETTVASGGKIVLPEAPETYTDDDGNRRVFIGWYCNGWFYKDSELRAIEVVRDLIIEPYYGILEDSYHIVFTVGDDTIEYDLAYGEALPVPEVGDKVVQGGVEYKFSGWLAMYEYGAMDSESYTHEELKNKKVPPFNMNYMAMLDFID